MTKRIDWIDVTKGIGVLCIIFGHISFYRKPTLLQIFVYGFSVFCFFIISGFNFQNKINLPISKVIKGLFKNLVLPYIISIIIILIFKFIYYQGILNIQEIVFNYVTQVRYTSLWYVPVLFFGQIITWLLYQIVKNNKTRFVIVLCIYILSTFINRYFDLAWLWNLDLVAYGVFYINIGILLKNFIFNSNRTLFINLLLSVIFMIVSCVSTYYNYITNSTYNYISFTNIHIVPLSVLSAITGTISIILVAKIIHKCKFLQYLGKNSFSFIAFNTETIGIILNETEINKLFWYGSTTYRTILYITLMIIGLVFLNILFKIIYKNTLLCFKKISTYNT